MELQNVITKLFFHPLPIHSHSPPPSRVPPLLTPPAALRAPQIPHNSTRYHTHRLVLLRPASPCSALLSLRQTLPPSVFDRHTLTLRVQPHNSTVARDTPVLVDTVPVPDFSSKMGFSFERMASSFENIQSDFQSDNSALPSTKRFLEAMAEVNSLFETLGSPFTFIKRDIEKKISIIHRYSALDPANFSHLHSAINYEIDNQCFDAPVFDGLPNCSRTLLRLMWALRFADCLLEGLGQTFDPRSDLRYTDRTLRWAVARAYDATLAANHSWTIRRSVKGACLLLPSKEAFLDRVGLDLDQREEFIGRLGISMSPLVQRMYAFYDRHGLLDLP